MKPLFLTLAAIAGLNIVFTSCDHRPDLTGVWTGTPIRLDNVEAAIDAHATYSLEFSTDDTKNQQGGQLTISSLINADQAVSGTDSVSLISPYETSVSATATISGRWQFEKDDDDDIIVYLEPSTLSVTVDPEGVTFSQNMVSGEQEPVSDTLTAETVNAWTKILTRAMREKLSEVNKISDIELHGDIMSCEIHGRDYSFRKL